LELEWIIFIAAYEISGISKCSCPGVLGPNAKYGEPCIRYHKTTANHLDAKCIWGAPDCHLILRLLLAIHTIVKITGLDG